MHVSPLEIEIRYEVPTDEDRARVIALLEGLAAVETQSQTDVYFTSKHKDFIASEECLRIRTVDGESIITWKPPSDDEMRASDHFWKEEVDVPVGGHQQEAQRLLERLDFRPVVTVEKVRAVYRISEFQSASIDVVARAGTFIEIETISSDRESALESNRALAKMLGISGFPVSKTPYRDLVIRDGEHGSAWESGAR